jgi:hypothetical protein
VPIAYRVDREARVVVAAAYGTLTDDEMFAYQQQGFKLDEALGYDELVDLTHVKEITLPSTDRVRELAERAAGMDVKQGGSKLAVVAPGDLAFALGRMFQTIRELDSRSTTVVGVFRSTEEALAFLGVDHPLALPALERA